MRVFHAMGKLVGSGHEVDCKLVDEVDYWLGYLLDKLNALLRCREYGMCIVCSDGLAKLERLSRVITASLAPLMCRNTKDGESTDHFPGLRPEQSFTHNRRTIVAQVNHRPIMGSSTTCLRNPDLAVCALPLLWRTRSSIPCLVWLVMPSDDVKGAIS